MGDYKSQLFKTLKKAQTMGGPILIYPMEPTEEYSYSDRNMTIIIPLAYLVGVRVSYRRMLVGDRVRMGLSLFGKQDSISLFESLVASAMGMIYGKEVKSACMEEYTQINMPLFKKQKHYGVPRKYASDISLLLYDYISLFTNKTLEVWGYNPNLLNADKISLLRPTIHTKTLKNGLGFKVKSRNVRLCDYILNPLG